MGSRATDTLKDIEKLRSSLEHKLNELEHRFPLAGFGRKAAAMLGGGTAGGTAVAFAWRRLRRGSRKARKAAKAEPVTPSVTVNVFPKGAAWIAAAGLAAWAAARVYESIGRTKSDKPDERSSFMRRPAVVKPMPDAERQSGAGS